jgi:hypothetical protein
LLGISKPQGVAVDSVAGKPIKIDFPFIAPMQFQNAELVSSLWRLNNEDLAILKIEASLDGAAPLAFPKSTYYQDHRYRVCGFPDGHPDGIWATGVFLDEQAKGWIQIEDTKAEGLAIEPGFSGAPIWDETLEGLAGMTVARDKEREDAKVGFMIPYLNLKPALEASILFALMLSEEASLTPHWEKAYKLLRPESYTESYPKTLEEAILKSQDLPNQGSAYRAIEQFIGYLTLPELGLRIQPKLFQWLAEQVADVNDLLGVVRQKKEAQQTQQSLVSTPHLLFWVQEELNSDRFFAQAYLVLNREQYDPAAQTGVKQLRNLAQLFEAEGDEKVSPSQLETVLQICLNESVQEIPQEQEDFPVMQVDVFLPRRALGWQVEQWYVEPKDEYTLKPEPVGSCYRVILRLADRLDERRCTPQRKQLWKAKWRYLKTIEGNPTAAGLIGGDDKETDALYEVLSKEEIVGWHRLQPPQPAVEGTPCPFSILVGTGASVAIWLRPSQHDYKQLFAQLLGSGLSELPAKVSSLRKEAFRRQDQQNPHIGEAIGLLWEDPQLVPPGAVKPSRLRMSA